MKQAKLWGGFVVRRIARGWVKSLVDRKEGKLGSSWRRGERVGKVSRGHDTGVNPSSTGGEVVGDAAKGWVKSLVDTKQAKLWGGFVVRRKARG